MRALSSALVAANSALSSEYEDFISASLASKSSTCALVLEFSPFRAAISLSSFSIFAFLFASIFSCLVKAFLVSFASDLNCVMVSLALISSADAFARNSFSSASTEFNFDCNSSAELPNCSASRAAASSAIFTCTRNDSHSEFASRRLSSS